MRTWQNKHHPKGDGPWANEPDKAQWVDESTGLDCLIVRNQFGALCGYVGVPPGHLWHGESYDTVNNDDVIVHGGLTFEGLCHEGSPEESGICHVAGPGRPERVWWLGFDCAHAGDVAPTGLLSFPGDTYRTFEYVKSECEKLAAQAQEARLVAK